MGRDPLDGENLYSYVDNGLDVDLLGGVKFEPSCDKIKDYCEKDFEGIISELDKIAPEFKPQNTVIDNNNGRKKNKGGAKSKINDPLWKAILEIYTKRGLVDDKGKVVMGIWNSSEDVRRKIQRIKSDLKGNEPSVICCPQDPDGKLCGNSATSGGYVQYGNGGTFGRGFEGKIYICPSMMTQSAMISRNGGCGCFIMHELMHRHGMRIPSLNSMREKYELQIENAMIEIQQYILRELTDRTCKGYDIM